MLAIHDDQIEQYGGANGFRDRGQLEATAFRPQAGYYPDAVAEAAALRSGFSCCRSGEFEDTPEDGDGESEVEADHPLHEEEIRLGGHVCILLTVSELA